MMGNKTLRAVLVGSAAALLLAGFASAPASRSVANASDTASLTSTNTSWDPLMPPNEPAAGNARSVLPCAIARQWPGVPGPERSVRV